MYVNIMMGLLYFKLTIYGFFLTKTFILKNWFINKLNLKLSHKG